MNFIIIRDKLKKALSMVGSAIQDHGQLPILGSVLLETKDNSIMFSGTNLEIAITAPALGKVIVPGSVAIPYHSFSSLIDTIRTERITLENKAHGLEIVTDNYHATLQTLPVQDFPIIPKLKKEDIYIDVDISVFRGALAHVLLATQFSELRQELNVVLLSLGTDAFRIVGTDSFRLAEYTIPTNQYSIHGISEGQFLLPLKSAHSLFGILPETGSLRISTDNQQILFSSESFTFTSRLHDSRFPDYQHIIPDSFNADITFDREECLHALKLVSVMGDKSRTVVFRVRPEEKAIHLFSVSQGIGENEYVLPAKIKGNAGEVQFNARYISDGLRAFSGEDVSFQIRYDQRPALLRPLHDGRAFYLVMPILGA